MLEAERAEMDEDARRQRGFEIQNYLLENTLAMINWVASTQPGLIWSYFKNDIGVPSFGFAFNRANMWLDQKDRNFQGRPA
jgi:hypothetical protein